MFIAIMALSLDQETMDYAISLESHINILRLYTVHCYRAATRRCCYEGANNNTKTVMFAAMASRITIEMPVTHVVTGVRRYFIHVTIIRLRLLHC